jgi:hypothetical protein
MANILAYSSRGDTDLSQEWEQTLPNTVQNRDARHRKRQGEPIA